MATSKMCPRCGTALNQIGEKYVCPSCRASLTRKSKSDIIPVLSPVAVLPVEPPALTVAPLSRPALPSSSRKFLVLGGAALFFLLGTVLTGYAFSLTFAPAQAAPGDASGQPEEWRATLRDLRALVTTPPQLPTNPVVEELPVDPRVKSAIERGVAFLKAHGTSNVLALGLAGLTLLECGVPASDPAVRTIAEQVRQRAPKLGQTYEIASYIWFLDRLGEERDRALIRSLALRLIAGQHALGGWNYLVTVITPAEEQDLMQLLSERPLNASWREEMNAALSTGGTAGGAPKGPKRPSNMSNLPVFRWEPGKKYQPAAPGREDNSLTQFAVLGLWAARKHGVPVERPLAFTEWRFRTHQNADGSWGYMLRSTGHRDSMTCAGLLGLAVGRGLDRQSGAARGEVQDRALEKGLIYVGQIIGKQAVTRGKPARGGGGGRFLNADAGGDLYFLWSLERMAVVWDLRTVAGKDWYDWGSKLILDAQTRDGSWHERFVGVPDTCFALLFLKRVNVVQDLTAHLRLLGKVKDPGNARPSVVLPGETVKHDDQ
jgi:hypothetical protein